MRIVNILLTLIFILFAAFQFNDPDPLIWITWYAFIATLTGFAIFKRYSMLSIFVGMLVNGIALGSYYSDFVQWIRDGMPSIVTTMKAETPYVENVRESLGLFVCVVVLFILFFQARNFEWSFLTSSSKRKVGLSKF